LTQFTVSTVVASDESFSCAWAVLGRACTQGWGVVAYTCVHSWAELRCWVPFRPWVLKRCWVCNQRFMTLRGNQGRDMPAPTPANRPAIHVASFSPSHVLLGANLYL
ncbi:unnamed protein product, partial [Ectocarpus sp. 12 AP-2014]